MPDNDDKRFKHMSRKEYDLASCRGKEQLTRDVASLMVRKARKRVKLSSYRCEICGHWHVGTALKKAKRIRPAKGE